MRKYFYYGLLLLTLCTEANASIIYESATGPFNIYANTGGSSIDSTSFIGAVFSVNETTQIDGIGGHFNNTGDPDFAKFLGLGGSIFGAIVSLDSNGLPEGNLTGLKNVIAYSVFTPNLGKDTLTPLSTTLSAGNYGLVFGSGLFGASGKTVLTLIGVNSADTSKGDMFWLNDSNLLDWTLADEMKGSNRYRMFVSGTTVLAVPEPEVYAMMLAGLSLIGFVARRKQA